ncbi:hypothetical protein ACFOKF_19520 [Sphingobium rhizovicinum]|uniref:Uncharacterized protein n=1 Tax=Sphingobium rhizovicinum TaxID=432308 RepID=A0ABV7NKJ3_9SPHN
MVAAGKGQRLVLTCVISPLFILGGITILQVAANSLVATILLSLAIPAICYAYIAILGSFADKPANDPARNTMLV